MAGHRPRGPRDLRRRGPRGVLHGPPRHGPHRRGPGRPARAGGPDPGPVLPVGDAVRQREHPAVAPAAARAGAAARLAARRVARHRARRPQRHHRGRPGPHPRAGPPLAPRPARAARGLPVVHLGPARHGAARPAAGPPPLGDARRVRRHDHHGAVLVPGPGPADRGVRHPGAVLPPGARGRADRPPAPPAPPRPARRAGHGPVPARREPAGRGAHRPAQPRDGEHAGRRGGAARRRGDRGAAGPGARQRRPPVLRPADPARLHHAHAGAAGPVPRDAPLHPAVVGRQRRAGDGAAGLPHRRDLPGDVVGDGPVRPARPVRRAPRRHPGLRRAVARADCATGQGTPAARRGPGPAPAWREHGSGAGA